MSQHSGLSRHVDLNSPAFHTPQTRRRKRPKSRINQDVDRADCFPANASASSWGAADGADEDASYEVYTSSSSSTEEDDDDGVQKDAATYRSSQHGLARSSDSQDTPGTRQRSSHDQLPPRKRRILASEDVGRFANMAIEPSARVMPTSVVEPSSRPPRRAVLDVQEESPQQAGPSKIFKTAGQLPIAIEEPVGSFEDATADTDMCSRRRPQTVQVDENRFYVTSLSDSSSDEEENASESQKRKERTAKALSKASREQVDRILASKDERTQYFLNGELVSRLQALEWQRRLALDREKAAAPLFKTDFLSRSPRDDDKRAALVLWRDPQHVSMQFGSGQIDALPAAKPPPVVYDDGDYAYVRRSSEQPSFEGKKTPWSSSHRANVAEEAMDLDA